MRKVLSGVLACWMAFHLSGCASIVGKDSFPLTINSSPDGAMVRIEDEHGRRIFTGMTPTTVTLSAGEAYFHGKTYYLTFSKSGYADQQTVVKSTISGWYFGNILFGGLIGLLIVDPVTGKMWKLPQDVYGNLVPQLADGQVEEGLQIVTLDQISPELRDKMVSLN